MNKVNTEIGEGLKVVVWYIYHAEEKPVFRGQNTNPGSLEEYEIYSVKANGFDVMDSLDEKTMELMHDACVTDRLNWE